MLAASAMRLMAYTHRAAASGCLVTVPRQLQHSRVRAYAATATDGTAAGQETTGSTPVYATFAVYKGKGALNVRPVKPEWKVLDNGAWKVDREGAFQFEIATAMGERRYDWENKVNIHLGPLELAALVTSPEKEHTFYHDTFKGQAGREGTKVKTFKWSMAPDGAAYFINASMTDKTEGQDKKASASVSLTLAEFYVLRRLVDYCLPSLFGFDVAISSP